MRHGALPSLAEAARPLYVNGRFTAQRLTGVQRFAQEMTSALRRRYGERLRVLVPPDAEGAMPGARYVGRLTGQLWEQYDLPSHCRDGILINLGNTAPLLVRRQIVVIHDAGVFSTPEAYSAPFRTWYKILQRGLVRRGVSVVTVSDFSRQELVRHLKIKPDNIAVISEGADHMCRLSGDARILAAHGLRKDSYVFAVGTLAAHKNLAALGQLSSRLRARGMVLAITGAAGAAVFQNADASRLPADALYLGRVDDAALKTLFMNAAAYVLPSRYEGFGLPAVEAMSCGCPVVAADIPALRESCGAGAVYVPPDDPTAIADAVLSLVESEDRRENLRLAGTAHVRSVTWERAANALSSVIENLRFGSLVSRADGNPGRNLSPQASE